jgi:Rrf2 family protein
MKISTKGRYGLLIMLDLASEYESGRFVSLKEIADKENISLKYLEKLMLNLKKGDFFISSTGTSGGYKLKNSPDKYTLGDILRVAEGDLNVTSCLTDGCPMEHKCKSFRIWKDLNDVISNHLDSKTLKDYMEE